ncbi:ATPase family aaa domain-containing protein 1-a [Apiospora rasikravindrae]|uniref:ATPase family aaa domain-containing protein 1-a n=1 Tax=Apiospora rasikravindrae TaxID=990691 RepID=A0ABR1S210_9PEZI
MRMVSQSIEKPEAYGILKRAQTGGALLYGPPGTGKTHLARVLAKESNASMIQISAASIESKYVGETEKLVKALFHLGRMVSPSIIFIDEADALFRMRAAGDQNWETSRVNQLLNESDGLLKNEKARPFLILATNYPNNLDHAVLRRIPGRVYLGPPSSKAREAMFRIYLRDEDLDRNVRLSDLASMTEKYSGSDLRAVCIHAATTSQSELESMGEEISNRTRVLKMCHFKEALKANTPTITRHAMKEIERFADQFDRQSVDRIRSYFNIQPPIPTNRYESPVISKSTLDPQGDKNSLATTEAPMSSKRPILLT